MKLVIGVFRYFYINGGVWLFKCGDIWLEEYDLYCDWGFCCVKGEYYL